jgi:phage terminase small subunit
MRIYRDNTQSNPIPEPIKPKQRHDFKNPTNQKKYFKIKRFVDEYLVDLNIYKAWERCGYGKFTNQEDRIQANRAFQRPDVQQLIAEGMDKRAKAVEITQERVLKELSLIAFQNMKDISDWDGNNFILKPFDELTRDQVAVISEIQIIPGNYGVGIKFRTYNKQDSLNLVARHVGLVSDSFGNGNGGGKNDKEDPIELARMTKAALREMDEKSGSPS